LLRIHTLGSARFDGDKQIILSEDRQFMKLDEIINDEAQIVVSAASPHYKNATEIESSVCSKVTGSFAIPPVVSASDIY